MRNPKDIAGDIKTPMHLLPLSTLGGVAWALKHGADKYGEYNWRKESIEAMSYVAATLRHIAAFQDGKDHDLDSGHEHLDHAIATLIILQDARKRGSFIDNRPNANPKPLPMLYDEEEIPF